MLALLIKKLSLARFHEIALALGYVPREQHESFSRGQEATIRNMKIAFSRVCELHERLRKELKLEETVNEQLRSELELVKFERDALSRHAA